MNWWTVLEILLGASLACIGGAVLQWRLLVRQKRFQERMEAKRAEEDARAEKRRLETEQQIAGHHRETLRKIAMENRNFEAVQRSDDRWAA